MLELVFSDYRPFIQDAVAIILIVAALIWGGGPERIFALTWLVFFELLDLLYQATGGGFFQSGDIEFYIAATDLFAGLIWITCALFANRNYMLWIAAMQLLAMTAHVARGLVEAISPIAYAVMVIAPGWLQLLFFGIGLARHIQRKRKYGPYRDWRISRQWSLASQNTGKKWTLIRILGHDFFTERKN
ncbi:hypothetical protein [Erythrobacter sp. YT30]|uniref:hypothetical protein n=1 Tax=Erythrobacter sp. YT30 TaxID=1735012 RepID=UPI00076C5C88|nr:hypothetical protein [Erythrobacter sp. YT30]KWV91877.1 hypothetical protein AUC45_11920 [Erythrobacter sp. YT30]